MEADLLSDLVAVPRRRIGDAWSDETWLEKGDRARHWLEACPGYQPTPLKSLPGLAGQLGLSAVLLKDESMRFGLGSFKSVGAFYALLELAAELLEPRLGGAPTPAELAAGTHSEELSQFTVACATDGNHGRAVAAGARLLGFSCVVGVPDAVSERRVAAIAALGAQVRRIPGDYDNAVRVVTGDAVSCGWIVVSDTSWPGYERVPDFIMSGYSTIVAEVIEQLRSIQAVPTPSHVFIQAGVGAFAASVAVTLAKSLGRERPCVVVVEPRAADAIQASARAQRLVPATGNGETIMAGLACRTASFAAWRYVQRYADYVLTIPEDLAVTAMRRLAMALHGDPPIIAGETGAAGLAGLLFAVGNPRLRQALAIDATSTVLLFGTEGATDPDQYERLTGLRLASMSTTSLQGREP